MRLLKLLSFQRWGTAALLLLAVLVECIDPGALWAGNDAWTSLGLDGSIQTMAIDPQNPNILYAVTQAGLFKSRDRGVSWSASNAGLRSGVVGVLAIDPGNSNTLYVAGDGVFKSTNGGESWSAASSGVPTYDQGFWVNALAIDPQHSDTLYVGLRDTGECKGRILKSVDGGGEWTESGFGNSEPSASATCISALIVDPQSPDTLYAAFEYSGGIFKSGDGGAGWTAVNAGLPVSSIVSLAIDPRNPASLFALTGHGDVFGPGSVFKSADGAMSWVPAGNGLPTGAVPNFISGGVLAVDPDFLSTVYLGAQLGLDRAGGGVFASADGGASWGSIGLIAPQVSSLVLDGQDPTTIYAGTSGGGSGNTLEPPRLYSALENEEHQGAILHANTPRLASVSDPAIAGEALEIYGAGLIDGGTLPPKVSIGGRLTEILFFGNAPGLPGSNQVNVRVPSGIAPNSAVPVTMDYLGRTSNPVTIAVQSIDLAAPMLLSVSRDGQGQGSILHANTPRLATPDDPAVEGEALEVYCTGLIDGASDAPDVSIGGKSASVLWFGGTPGYAGLNQVDVRVPSGVTPGSSLPVRLTYLGRVSNEVTIAVR